MDEAELPQLTANDADEPDDVAEWARIEGKEGRVGVGEALDGEPSRYAGTIEMG